ncbi:hypothetical protein LIA77_06806 [Sarocladium implicatum]|nr:hypothetical protein LIA77_06806 [Sarocladium implicatum]
MHTTTFFTTIISLASSSLAAPTAVEGPRWENPIPAPKGLETRNTEAHPMSGLVNKRQGFVGGWCGVHVQGIDVFDGENEGQRRGTVKIYDGQGWLSWASEEVSVQGGAVQIDGQGGGMPERLWTTIFPEGLNDDIARFSYGDKRWASGKADSETFDDGGVLLCKVGRFDNGGGLLPKNQKVNLDCGFSC